MSSGDTHGQKLRRATREIEDMLENELDYMPLSGDGLYSLRSLEKMIEEKGLPVSIVSSGRNVYAVNQNYGRKMHVAV